MSPDQRTKSRLLGQVGHFVQNGDANPRNNMPLPSCPIFYPKPFRNRNRLCGQEETSNFDLNPNSGMLKKLKQNDMKEAG